MSTLRLRWQFFWSKRSRTRTALALVFATVALLAIIYLALSPSVESQVTSSLVAVGQQVTAVGIRPLIAAGIALCVVLSLIFISVPSYRKPRYLATVPSIIPSVSVYLDAENQLSAAAIRPFIEFLMKHLDGRRADLLYFLDASQTATGEKYKMLYRFGFRPVDVPHDPTGKGTVKEAVDRELAMHAYERALLGPPEQEFIIVTGDGDFVPLIYRLSALGHHVQVWAISLTEAYRVVEMYLGVNVIALSQVISELAITQPDVKPDANPKPTVSQKRKRGITRRSASSPKKVAQSERIPSPVSLSESGEEKFYYAVAETLAAQGEASRKFAEDSSRNGLFYGLMRGKYGPRLAGVGYSVGNWLEYWLEHLTILGVLVKSPAAYFRNVDRQVPRRQREVYSLLSKAAARAAAQVGATHDDGVVRMSEVASALAAQSSSADEDAALLFKLAPDTGRGITSIRYFVRSARALGLLEFQDNANSFDIIVHPRVPDATAVVPSDAGVDEIAEIAISTTSESPEEGTRYSVADSIVLTSVVEQEMELPTQTGEGSNV